MPVETNTHAKPEAAADPAAAMVTFWTQWLEQSSRGTQALLEAAQSISDPTRLQQVWLDAVAQSLDSFMRTPAFMEMMRRNLKAITDLKTMQDQAVHGAARHLGMPLAADIGGLFERLNSTEQTILNRLQAIERRLDALAQPDGPRAKRPGAAKAHEDGPDA
jgi:hypothetical protein